MSNAEIRVFERALDEHLLGLPTFGYDANASLALAANMYEVAAANDELRSRAESLHRGITILAPRLVSGAAGLAPDIAALFKDIEFAAHYYMIREYLYYSYNVPDSFIWTFSERRVDVRFNDRSIPRQFFTVHNDFILKSRDHFAGFGNPENVRALLKGQPEGETTDNVVQAAPLLEQEVELKLAAYFSILGEDLHSDLGGYSYAQFLKLYRSLMGNALYHRYFAQANNAPGAIFIVEQNLLQDIERAEIDIPVEAVKSILNDIVFGIGASDSRTDASYFSLLREGASPGRIVLMPHHFATSEGLVNLLRVVAQRRPATFLKHLSEEIGKQFTERVKTMFEAQGFSCRSNVSLRDIDPKLPDLDLLVISEEPTLGYVLLVCELKSPLPPRWAKDQLKVLNKDSISKAFRQAKAISSFLKTDQGIYFLRSLLPESGLAHFDGFVVVVEQLIVTSDNAGMFFSEQKTKIINFRTLERLLKRSDGDMAFIQHVLHTYNKHADEAIRTTMTEFEFADFTVSYEAVTNGPLLDFPTLQWRSSSKRDKWVNEFIESGLHPFDVFGKKKNEIKGPTRIVFGDVPEDS
ncbi:MAG: hypothetical protein EKK40_13755 [Bradyrhizobiaceae bacterium]|nr:MAG: hypothetical protein EKK40_13755 [Bradyrhizobiaceae bacterium]